eukprot:319424_1
MRPHKPILPYLMAIFAIKTYNIEGLRVVHRPHWVHFGIWRLFLVCATRLVVHPPLIWLLVDTVPARLLPINCSNRVLKILPAPGKSYLVAIATLSFASPTV